MRKGDRIEVKNNNHLSDAASFWLPIAPVVKGDKGKVICIEYSEKEEYYRVRLDGHVVDIILPITDMLLIS